MGSPSLNRGPLGPRGAAPRLAGSPREEPRDARRRRRVPRLSLTQPAEGEPVPLAQHQVEAGVVLPQALPLAGGQEEPGDLRVDAAVLVPHHEGVHGGGASLPPGARRVPQAHGAPPQPRQGPPPPPPSPPPGRAPHGRGRPALRAARPAPRHAAGLSSSRGGTARRRRLRGGEAPARAYPGVGGGWARPGAARPRPAFLGATRKRSRARWRQGVT